MEQIKFREVLINPAELTKDVEASGMSTRRDFPRGKASIDRDKARKLKIGFRNVAELIGKDRQL